VVNGLSFFDCNAFIGQPAVVKYFPERVTVPVLRREYDRLGIDRALVTHVAAKEYAPSVGNDLLRDELDEADRFSPCVTLIPPLTGELWQPEEIIGELTERGARAARLFPSLTGHRYPFDLRVIGSICDVLQAARVPLFIDFELGRRDEADWVGLYDLADAYPGLPIVLIRPGGRSDRGLYPLLTRSANVFIESGGYWVHNGIEKICDVFGAERIMFGSGFPYWTPSGAVFHVATAAVSDTEKALIAHGNLERVLSEVNF
jgi:predicted TIM-barrel fold metal-dependent hydrolase